MARVKVKSIKLDDDDANLSSVFNKLIGAEEADIEVIRPKYIKLRNKVVVAAKLLDCLTIDKIADIIPDQRKSLIEINQFANELITISKIKEIEEDKLPEESDSMNALYKELKDNPRIRVLFIIMKDLRQYDRFLRDEISDSWIIDMPGFTFKIFSNFSEFDIKSIWMMETVPDVAKQYILKTIAKLYRVSEDIAEIVTSPDVDPEAFSNVLITQIAALRKHIPRCDDAFNRIAESTNLLKNNFNQYYRGFVQSGDPTSMIQSFVLDVSANSKVSPKITRQYRQIIQFYNTKTSSQPIPEKFKKVMQRLNETYDLVEKKHSEQHEKEDSAAAAVDSTSVPKTEAQRARDKRKKDKKKKKEKKAEEIDS